MAMTATVSVSPSTAVTEQDVTAIFTISNSAAFPVVLTNIIPYAYPSGSSLAAAGNSGVSWGPLNIGPNVNLTVPNAGSLILTLPLTVHGPASGALNGTVTGGTTFQQVFKVGGTCYSADGSVFVPSEATLTVNNAVTFGSEQD